MSIDHSGGWDEVAEQFMAVRSDIGARLVRSWARDNLPPSSSIVDIGCGSGKPITQALIEDGLTVFGIDALPQMITAFHHHFPDMPYASEKAQDSVFFHQTFAGAVSIGLLFLLSAEDPQKVFLKVANTLKPGGNFLFSAPLKACEWEDTLTGRLSRSLGKQVYERYLKASGLHLIDCFVDEGKNNYFHACNLDKKHSIRSDL